MSFMRTRLEFFPRRSKDARLATSSDGAPDITLDENPLPAPFSLQEEKRYGLNVIYDGTEKITVNGTTSDYLEEGAIDIVAVHGLNGHPSKSFTDELTGTCWLKDFLPIDFPKCRVLSFGWNADVFSHSIFAHATFSDRAEALCQSL
jgi:hypothetical protein